MQANSDPLLAKQNGREGELPPLLSRWPKKWLSPGYVPSLWAWGWPEDEIRVRRNELSQARAPRIAERERYEKRPYQS